MEAMDTSVPLLERLRFIAIYSSNLDEFFRVRVANIRNLARIDKKKINKRIDFNPVDLLNEIHDVVSQQLEEYGKTFREIIDELKSRKYVICTNIEEIPDQINQELLHYFKTKVAAYLRPVVIEKKEELFLDNQAVYLAVQLKSKKSIIVNIPSEQLGRFYSTKVDDVRYYVFIDDIIRLHLDILLPGEQVEECHCIKLNKDADLQIDDEFEGDLVKKIEKQIQKRNLGIPSRFLFDGKMSDTFLKTLIEKLQLEPDEVVKGGRYHNMNDFFQISVSDSEMEYPSLPPIGVNELEESRSIMKKIEEKELLLHFPYQSYDYVLQFFSESAIDPDVTEIHVTFYRMAKKSMIGEALISAALNGKKVTVFMEVKARFDEENNLEWAKRMKAAGVKIVYSLPGLKVHAKVALVKKKNRMYGFFGTGNLNEKTSEIYCDHGLLTTHEQMTHELSNVFEYLVTKYTPPTFEHLIVSQFGAPDRFAELIDKEIANAEAGKEARIIIKINNLQEEKLIKKLYQAASNGVDVKLIVRSICCLVPKKNLQVKRIVDRYLEHARIFYFHNDGAANMYMGSSDWMNRNLYRRVEVTFPIYEDAKKQELLTILKFQWQDDIKGVWFSSKMNNKRPKMEHEIRAQMATYDFLKDQYG